MKKHRARGFTIVELITVIVIVAILATITSIAYRETQKNARDEKRKVDALMLKSAVDEYYADKGGTPIPNTCSSGPGGTNECWLNEIWLELKAQGYLRTVPEPDLVNTRDTSTNIRADGKSNYGWVTNASGSYAIYVLMESGYCKLGKKMPATWWNSMDECTF